MRPKLLLTSILLLISVATYGQVETTVSYDDTAIIVATKNITADTLIVFNERRVYDDGSYIIVKIYDKRGELIYDGRWGFGQRSSLAIKPGQVQEFVYSFRLMGVRRENVKKITFNTHIRTCNRRTKNFEHTRQEMSITF